MRCAPVSPSAVTETYFHNGALVLTTLTVSVPDGNLLQIHNSAGGDLDELRVWLSGNTGAVLSAADVYKGYAADVWPTAYLIAYFPFSDHQGTTITDYSGIGNHITGAPFGSTYMWNSNGPACPSAVPLPAPQMSTLSLPYKFNSVQAAITWGGALTMSVQMDQISIGPITTSGGLSSVSGITVGSHTLQFALKPTGQNQPIEPTYTYNIIRRPQDVSGFAMYCNSLLGSYQFMPIALTPYFTPGTFAYSAASPVTADYDVCAIKVVYATPGTVSFTYAYAGVASFPAAASTSFSPLIFPLQAGVTNTMTINSVLDGQATVDNVWNGWT
jgi:hypothetical protein